MGERSNCSAKRKTAPRAPVLKCDNAITAIKIHAFRDTRLFSTEERNLFLNEPTKIHYRRTCPSQTSRVGDHQNITTLKAPAAPQFSEDESDRLNESEPLDLPTT